MPANSTLKNNKFINHLSPAALSSNTAAAAVYGNSGISMNTNAGKGYNNSSNVRNIRDMGDGIRGADMSISNFNTTAASVYGFEVEKGDGSRNQMQIKSDQQHLMQPFQQHNLYHNQYNSSFQGKNNDKQITSLHTDAGKWQQQGQPAPLQQKGLGHGHLQHPTQLKQQQQQKNNYLVQPLEVSSRTIPSVRTSLQAAPVQQLYSAVQRTSANPHSNVGHTMRRGTGAGSSNGRGARVDAGAGVGIGNEQKNTRLHEIRGVEEYGDNDTANNRNGRVDEIQNSKTLQQHNHHQHNQRQHQYDIRDEGNLQDIHIIDTNIDRRASGRAEVGRNIDLPYNLNSSPEMKKQRVSIF